MVGSRETVLQSSFHRILKRTKSKLKKKRITIFTKSNTKLKNKNLTKPKANKYMATRIRRYRKLQNTRYSNKKQGKNNN